MTELDGSTRPRPLRRDAAENRERLLAAAAEVFAVQGPGAGVDDVARAAGVGMGTLYRRFPTKDALMSALVRELLDDLVAMARAESLDDDGTGLERVLYSTAEMQASHRGCLSRLWSDEHTAALKVTYRAILVDLLIRAKAAGRIRADVADTDLDLTFWAVAGVIETTRGVSDLAWQRHLAIVVAGMRPGAEPLAPPPLTAAQSSAVKAGIVPTAAR